MKSSSTKATARAVLSSAPPPSSWRSILSLRGGGGNGGGGGVDRSGTSSSTSRSSRMAAYRRQSSADDAYYDLDESSSCGGGGGTSRGFPGPSFAALATTSPNRRRPVGGGANATATTTTSTSTSSSSNQHNNKTPFLTLVLLKLDGLLDEYCLLLSQPSYANAVRASVLMETCIATATTTTSIIASSSSASPGRLGSALSSLLSVTRSPCNTHYHHHQQHPTTASPSNHSTGSAPSFRSWLPLSSLSDHRTTKVIQQQRQQQQSSQTPPASPSFLSQSAMALQGEWETYQRPFLLLAAALVLYHDLQHVHNNNNKNHDSSGNSSTSTTTCAAESLPGLFQYLASEFQTMEQTLCGPFLDMMNTTTSTANTNANSTKYNMAALHVAQTLRTLVAICQARCHLITMQCQLFQEMSSSWALSSFRDLAASKAQLAMVSAMTIPALHHHHHHGVDDSSGTMIGSSANTAISNGQVEESGDDVATSSSRCPLGEALLRELDTWKPCLDAAVALEACQFFDSIVSLAQFKQSLPASSSRPDSSPPTTTTRLDEWFQKTHRHFTLLLPIYFDRVQAFARPLYGFETQVGKTTTINNAAPTTSTTTTTPMASPPPLPPVSSSSTKNSNGNIEEDWNAMVGELLRRQDRLGGPPTAVALVLDAMGTNNLHVERGFQLFASKNTAPQPPPRLGGGGASVFHGNGISVQEQQQGAAPNDNAFSSHVLWPAIYLRSTTHLKSSAHMASSASFSSSRTSLVSSNSVRGPGGFLLAAKGFEWSSSSQDIANQNSPRNTVRKAALTASATNGASNSSLTTTNNARASVSANSNLSVLEYEPDAGKASSWPHTEWDSFVNTLLTARHHHCHEVISDDSDNLGDLREPPVLRPRVLVDGAAASVGGDGILASTTESVIATNGSPRHATLPRMMQEPIAVTYQEDGDDQVTHFQQQNDQSSSATSLPSDGGPAGIFGATSALSSSDQLSLLPVVSFTGNNDDNKVKRLDKSTFHVVSLSPFISLVVIVKGDNVEESRFLRRRSRVTDEDIRAFLDHWVQKIRVSNRFTKGCLVTLSRAKKARKEISLLEFSNAPQVTTTTSSSLTTAPPTWTAAHVQAYFKQVKEAFGLRPTSPIRGSTSRTRSFGRSRSNSTRGIGSDSPFGSKNWASVFLSSPRALSDLHAVTMELNGNIQKSIDVLFLGPDLAQVIEMYD